MFLGALKVYNTESIDGLILHNTDYCPIKGSLK